MYFQDFLKKCVALHFKKNKNYFYSLQTRTLCHKSEWFSRKNVFKFWQKYLHNLSITSISHWKRAWPFTWKNESPSSKYTLSQFTWNWPNGYRDFFMIAIFYYLFFLKGHAWPTWIPFTQECFVPSLIEIGQVVLENMTMCQVFRQMYGRTDWQQEKLTWAFITGKPKGYIVHLRNNSNQFTYFCKALIIP